MISWPRAQSLGTGVRGGGGEPGLYCEHKWLRNNSRGQDLTLYDAFTLTFIDIYVTLLDPSPQFIGYGATLLSPHFGSKYPLC